MFQSEISPSHKNLNSSFLIVKHIEVQELMGFPFTVCALKPFRESFLGIFNDIPSHDFSQCYPVFMARNHKPRVVDFELTLIETARRLRQHLRIAEDVVVGYLNNQEQTYDWQWWDSNPRPLRDWSLNPAP